MEREAQSIDGELPAAPDANGVRAFLRRLGPGLVTGAADDDPSGIATYSQVGAQFGYALGWTMVLSYPLMVAIQMISARVGRTTGQGIAGILRRHYPNSVLIGLIAPLLIANVINIGADFGAMADAAHLVLGGPRALYLIGFAGLSMALQVFMAYGRYVAALKWLTLVLLAYVATLFMVSIPWPKALTLLVVPDMRWNRDYLTAVVAVFGTTISPYLFFWQSSQEAEDVRVLPERKALTKAKHQGEPALQRIRLDTLVGMGISNVIGLAIIVTTAATLNAHGITEIRTSADAAKALRPIAGSGAEFLFALGIVGTGLLSIPVLAGSAAYAVGEARKWPVGLARLPMEAKAFYAAIVTATLVGSLMNLTPVDPIRALFWSAVINGVVAVPVMVMLMVLASQPRVMGSFVVRGWLLRFGWASTLVMATTVAAMVVTAF
jgi:Mn2+/Fe2+ NRAMP family transporter